MSDGREADFRCWHAVDPHEVLPDVAVVGHPVACVVVGPVDVAVGAGVAAVGAVDVAARDVVVRVFATVRQNA